MGTRHLYRIFTGPSFAVRLEEMTDTAQLLLVQYKQRANPLLSMNNYHETVSLTITSWTKQSLHAWCWNINISKLSGVWSGQFSVVVFVLTVIIIYCLEHLRPYGQQAGYETVRLQESTHEGKRQSGTSFQFKSLVTIWHSFGTDQSRSYYFCVRKYGIFMYRSVPLCTLQFPVSNKFWMGGEGGGSSAVK